MNWAEEEFNSADLGDLRRTDRLVQMAEKIVIAPECSLSSAMGNDADNKAAYRFFSNKAFDYQDIITPAIENCMDRINSKSRVLLIQDTCSLNYDSHKGTIGLGQIGSSVDTSFQGVLLHWTLAISEQGEPLGIADLQLWEREKDPRKLGLNQHQRKPIEEKESFKWIEALEKVHDTIPKGPQPIWVADREGDIYEFFDTILTLNHDFVIRCKSDRKIYEEEGLLKEQIRTAPIIGRENLTLKKKNNTEKTIRVEIQACEVELLAGRKTNAYKGCQDRHISVVRVTAREENLEWILLTSLEVSELDEALDVISIYKNRWHIESIHKTLKSGFKAQNIMLNHSFRLEKAIALLLPCAVHVYWMAHKHRHTPNEEVKILTPTNQAILRKINKKRSDYRLTYKEAWLWIGYLGGFRGSKNSNPPGQIVFWRGWHKLMEMSKGAELMMK